MESMVKRATKKKKQDYEKFLNSHKPKISVFGVGGSGGNTIVRLNEMGIEGAEMIAINTDAQDLAKIDVSNKVLIGKNFVRLFEVFYDKTKNTFNKQMFHRMMKDYLKTWK